jgi:dolichol-phosphate mannosyltransferase
LGGPPQAYIGTRGEQLHLKQQPERSGVYVLLPILNEIDNIGPLLDRIEQALTGRSYTIGIMDDGSKDGTLAYLAERMSHPNHHLHLICGKKTIPGCQRGGALRVLLLWGLQNTTHELFVEMDGDFSHIPEELLQGIQLIDENACDLAIASKYVSGGKTLRRSFGRRQLSRACSFAMRLLLDWRVRDYSNGYRFYSRAAAQLISGYKIRYTSPIYLSEVLALWMRHGLRVREFPTTYVGRDEGLSKVRIIDFLKGGLAAFEIAIRYHLTGFTTVDTGSAHSSRDSESTLRPDAALDAPPAQSRSQRSGK